MPRRYTPVKSARLFTKNIGYHEIDWNDWHEVIRRFKQQLHWWYISPMRHVRKRARHSGFTVVALGSVLIDTLSQYQEGLEQSKGWAFKKFVRARLTSHGGAFTVPIRTWNELNGQETQAVDFADVLWAGYRCGILHEAHAPLYGRLWGVSGLYDFVLSGFAKYADTAADCPTVSLNPGKFCEEVATAFDQFFRDLKNPANGQLKTNFKKKFLASYGIDIENEPP